ncbi:MAG: hypothetical protein LBS61_01040 [Endomicrobium sp.]|jgi:hypothetical protein|nr:hypothetical protein [Endomicrobium sp.]
MSGYFINNVIIGQGLESARNGVYEHITDKENKFYEVSRKVWGQVE